MTKVRSIRRGVGEPPADDLRAHVHFSESGQIWLHEHRMLLVHAEAQASLRRELIDTLGMSRAQGLFTRMGYACGVRDAELGRTRAQDTTDLEAFMTGPRLHTLEGMVNVTRVKLELDRAKGRFYGEFVWDSSWEGQWHRHYYGIHEEPVCWTQIGYMCGYASAFMGRPVLFEETECSGSGDSQCRIVGKPVEEWPEERAAEYQAMFDREPIAEQLLQLQTQVTELRAEIEQKGMLPADMVGSSPGFRAAYQLLLQAAPSQITVLLQGETGVGKELFARTLHEHGPRREAPFVAINCAAIPLELMEAELFGVEKGAYTGAQSSRPGRFERANGGTLFLDEIGDLPLPAQAKLLRVLQEGEVERLGDQRTRKVNVRLVAATNIELLDRVKEGRFRSDLYYRLAGYPIRIPPLRERKEDVALLAKAFLAKFSATNGKKLRGFTDKAKRELLAYPWPGNVRELMNIVERGVILAPNGSRIEVNHLFASQPGAAPREFGLDMNGSLSPATPVAGRELCDAVLNGVMTLDEIEAMLLETAVDKARGNLSSASRMLGITRPQLAYRLKRLHELAASPGEPQADEPPPDEP
jgi:DNA-binding NtrC family response regulator